MRWLLPVLGLVIGATDVAHAQSPAAELHALFAEAWAARLRDDPALAASVGAERHARGLPAISPRDQERQARAARERLLRLQRIERGALELQDRVSYDMFERALRGEIAEHEFRSYLVPLTSDWGFHIAFSRLPDQVPLKSPEDYERYLAHLRSFPGSVRQHVGLLREGLRAGITLPRVVLTGYDRTISAHVVEDPEASVFYAPFRSFPAGVPESEHARLRAAGREAIREAVVPGYRAFLEFMRDEYIPGARTSIAASALPNGRAYYDYLVRHFTTLDVSAEEVHRTGLVEVARIRAEMEQVIRQTGFEGSFADFLEFLRTDPRFYARTPEELLREAAWIAKRMDGRLPSLFGTLPRQPYGIEAVPAEIAPKFTGGRYVGAPLGSTRGGYYWVNTYDLKSRPLYVLESLTLHEAVPGHHLQNALQKELAGLPEFRRHAQVPAFGEGWGLYAERLGLEAGFYTDPYSNFGRLTYEMWRAVRLVVDTGIHALGWSRQQAIDYLAANTALSLHEVTTEVDRYISWPGQALAYKMGELKIRELRRRAEAALGERFDVREFHDAVLSSGEIPLSSLEEVVERYIATQRASS